jgi:hypothetical protein
MDRGLFGFIRQFLVANFSEVRAGSLMVGIMLAQIPQHEERKAMKMWRAKRVEQPPLREQLAFRRASIGALVLGPLAVHATAIGALGVRAP